MGGNKKRNARGAAADDWVVLDYDSDASSEGVLVEDPSLFAIGFDDGEDIPDYVGMYDQEFPSLRKMAVEAAAKAPPRRAGGPVSVAEKKRGRRQQKKAAASSAGSSPQDVPLAELIQNELQRYREYELRHPFDENVGEYDWLDAKLINYRLGGTRRDKCRRSKNPGLARLHFRPAA